VIPAIDVALAVALREGRVLVSRRSEGHLAGYWEFPGGKIHVGEAPADAARRELREETGLEAALLDPLASFEHAYPDRAIRFHAFLARDPQGAVALDGPREWAWLAPDEIVPSEMPPANGPLVALLRRRLEPGR
jgi:8-oxo-dGTP diphosphatase